MSVAEQVSTPAPVDEKAIVLRIASSGPDMGVEIPKSAPTPDNARKVSSDERQPDEKGQAPVAKPTEEKLTPEPVKAPEVADGKPIQPTEAKPEGEKKEVVAAPDAAAQEEAEKAAIRVRMGLKIAEPETIETLRKARAESSKEAHRLVEEMKLREKLLSDINLKIVKKTDGSFGLLADESKAAEKTETLAPSIMEGLTAEEKQLVHKDVANKIIQQTIAAMSLKSPKSTVTEADMVLPDSEIQTQLNSLASEKLPDKSEVYHGLGDDNFVSYMQEIYSSPELEPFRVVANRSPSNMKEFLKLVHGAVYRGYAPVLAKKADAAAQKKLKEDELLREPELTPSGRSPIDAKGQRGSTSQDLAKRIASAV